MRSRLTLGLIAAFIKIADSGISIFVSFQIIVDWLGLQLTGREAHVTMPWIKILKAAIKAAFGPLLL